MPEHWQAKKKKKKGKKKKGKKKASNIVSKEPSNEIPVKSIFAMGLPLQVVDEEKEEEDKIHDDIIVMHKGK